MRCDLSPQGLAKESYKVERASGKQAAKMSEMPEPEIYIICSYLDLLVQLGNGETDGALVTGTSNTRPGKVEQSHSLSSPQATPTRR